MADNKDKKEKAKDISKGEVSRGSDDPTARDGSGGRRTVNAKTVRSTTININPRDDEYAAPRMTYRGNRGTVRVGAYGYNPNDSIGNASRAASARFEARGQAMRDRIEAESKMSPHEKAMARNPRFKAMYDEVQRIAAQEKARQNGRIQAFSKGDVSGVGDRFNKSEWTAAGAGAKIDMNDTATRAKIDAINTWKDKQWTTTYDSKTGKSFNRYNENFDKSRIGGALVTDATGKQSFDFNNMTAAQLDMLTNVMKEDQATTGKATRDMNIAMANNKQQAVGQATDLLLKNGYQLTFDKNGKRQQSDEMILDAANALRKNQALATINGMKSVQDQLRNARTPEEFAAAISADVKQVDEMNNAFRQLTIAGVDPTVARHAVGGAGSSKDTHQNAVDHVKQRTPVHDTTLPAEPARKSDNPKPPEQPPEQPNSSSDVRALYPNMDDNPANVVTNMVKVNEPEEPIEPAFPRGGDSR